MHIKYRPTKWDDLIGQDHIIQGLKGINLSGRLVFLTGEPGTGKSTVGHLLANDFVDFKENISHINCVQTSKVEEMREYVNNFSKSTIFGKKKCFIFDEPQRLSDKAVDTLLIPSENLSDNVLIIMCSAKPEKIEPMLSDRALRFRTKVLDNRKSLKFINDICKKEGIKLSKYTKALIVEKSGGIPRKILTAIPKVANVEDEEDIKYLLEVNAIDEDGDVLLLFKMLLAKKSWREIKGYLNKLLKKKPPENIRVGLMNLIGHNLLSDYTGDREFLNNSFDYLSKNNFPEKAGLAVALSKITNSGELLK